MTHVPPEPALRSDDVTGVVAFGADPADVTVAIQRYGRGGCAALAGRIHEWTGWDVWDLRAWQHFCVGRPDGALVDIHGVFRPEDDGLAHVAARYDASPDDWIRQDPRRVCLMDNEVRRKIDAFLETPWGRAILPPSQRRAIPIYYADLDLDGGDA